MPSIVALFDEIKAVRREKRTKIMADLPTSMRPCHHMGVLSPATTVVLVHGAWLDGRCWVNVEQQLAYRGVRSMSVTLPSSNRSTGSRSLNRPLLKGGHRFPGFVDDVAAVLDVLDELGGDVILCGHSYGGMVISEAGEHWGVSKLVYVGALCPLPGETVSQLGLSAGFTNRRWSTGNDGWVTLKQPRMANRMFAGMLEAEARQQAACLVASSPSIFTARASRAAWKAKKTTYVVCSRDRIINPQKQRKMANRVLRHQVAGRRGDIITATINEGHCPFFTVPHSLAELIIS